jgi:hypothetical protein
MTCYQGAILMNKNGDDLDPLPEYKVACTKACYKEYLKVISDSGRGKWNTDGKNGPNDPNTSMKILIDWLLVEGNYNKYRGKNNNGVSKIQFATILADKMKSETISNERNAKQVMDRISRLEESFRAAHEFATSQTGAGIQDREGEGTFKDLVKKKCSHYYDLLDIMVDRASTEPRLTNHDPSALDSSDDDDDELPTNNTGTLSPPEGNGEGGAVIQNPSQVQGSSNNSLASSRKSTGKQSRKRSNVLMDGETVELLAESTRASKLRMQETLRHNKAVEVVEKERLELEKKKEQREDLRLDLDQQRFAALQWKGKSDELDYKVKLVRECRSLREQGMTDDQITTLFPEMKSVLEALKK